MAELTAGDERYRDDRGAADPVVEAALAAYAAGTGGEHAALAALAATRLLVPVVPVVPEVPEPDEPLVPGDGIGGGTGRLAGERATEMSLPALVGEDGRRALPAFTCADAVRRWKPSARPVPVQASAVWQSAAEQGSVVVIDIAGPVPFVVEGARLAALAANGIALGMHEDPDVWQQAAAAAGQLAPGVRVKLSPPAGDIDFTLELAPPEGAAGPVPAEVADRIGDAVLASLRDRVRAGIAVLVRSPGPG